MHWGVRRYQNKDGSLTSAGKQRIIEEKDRTTIKSGTTFNRISTRKETDVRSDRAYVTFDDEDHDFYKEHMTKFRRAYGGKNLKMYDVSLKNIKDVVYPTHEKQVDEFVKLYKDKKVNMLEDMASEAANRFLYNRYGINLRNDQIKISKDTTVKTVYNSFQELYQKNLNDENSLRTKGYEEFMRTYSDIPISKLYQERLIKQGYNAIMDDNDIMYNPMDKIRPKKSLIVFNPKENLEVTEAKELTNREYKKALKNNERRRKAVNK